MNEKENHSLIVRPVGPLDKPAPGVKHILSGMVGDALALANRVRLTPGQARFRIGEDAWCEPDYRQILLWAGAANVTPEDIVATLFCRQSNLSDEDGRQLRLLPFFDEPLVADGRLLKVTWDCKRIRCGRVEWIEGLQISHARFLGARPRSGECLEDLGALPLPELVWLSCTWQKLANLNLSRVPQLQSLHCASNEIEGIDLSAVPHLTELDCGSNRIAMLDLRAVPGLTLLDCSSNRLDALDLTHTCDLAGLFCQYNSISTLNLSGLAGLEAVLCDGNEIKELKLSNHPALYCLKCSDNCLEELDLYGMPRLEELDCSTNQIRRLHLRHCPNLKQLDCAGNCLSTLDIQDLECLECLTYDKDSTELLQRPDQHF